MPKQRNTLHERTRPLVRRAAALLPLLALVACAGEVEPPTTTPPPVTTTPPPPAVPPYEGNHVLDAVTHPLFFAAGHTPVEAPRAELCRRLYADLLGRFPTATEVASDCEGRPVDVIVRDLQSRPGYLFHAQRFWRDRLDTDDITVDWRHIKTLYELVDQVQRGDIAYDVFVERAASHPGFVMSEIQPEDRARVAYRAFLGREATDAEAADLASLYRPWIPAQEEDPDIMFGFRNRPYIYSIVCQPILHCRSELLGGGEVDLRGSGQMPIAYEDLRPWQLEQLGEPGRVIARQPAIWEAAADDILNRFLGWSDGGRFPREPGIVIPELRQALAEYLEASQSYADAELVVLTSWLYRQSTRVDDDGLGDDPDAPIPDVFLSGPIKPASAEVWLDSALTLTPGFGTCDARWTDGGPYIGLFNAINRGDVDVPTFEAEVARIVELLGDRRGLIRDGDSGILIVDFRYQQVARLIGGCPGLQNERRPPVGMAYSFSQETLAEGICRPGVAVNAIPTDGGFSLANIVSHQMEQVFGRAATDDDVALFTAAQRDCIGDECSPGATVNSTCVALLSSAEMLFY